MSACPPVDQCKVHMNSLVAKTQRLIDKLQSFAGETPIKDNPAPVDVPQVEIQINANLGELEIQWRHHGLLTRQLIQAPLDKMEGRDAHKGNLDDALKVATHDSAQFANKMKQLTKEKNKWVMEAMEAYGRWIGGTDPDEKADGGAAAVWAQTMALMDEQDEMLDDMLADQAEQNKKGDAALATMKEGTDLYKSNIADLGDIKAGFQEGINKLANLTATARKDYLGCGLFILCIIIILAAVYVSL